MAQKIQTLFVDDLDGSEAEGTVRFGLDGTHYEIDLSADQRRGAAERARALRQGRPEGHGRHPPASPQPR